MAGSAERFREIQTRESDKKIPLTWNRFLSFFLGPALNSWKSTEIWGISMSMVPEKVLLKLETVRSSADRLHFSLFSLFRLRSFLIIMRVFRLDSGLMFLHRDIYANVKCQILGGYIILSKNIILCTTVSIFISYSVEHIRWPPRE
jgi:hypothetical protein